MKLAAVQTGEHLENKWSRVEAAHVVAQTQKDMQEKLQVQVHSMSQQTHTHTTATLMCAKENKIQLHYLQKTE